MVEIDVLMKKFCNAGARSLERYARVSGEEPGELPEYFMPAFILDQLGNEITITIETHFSKLTKWNEDIRRNRQLPPLPPERKVKLLTLAEDIRGPRVDMVLYKGNDQDKLEFLALVEFKRHYEAKDDKPRLLRFLSVIDTCPYGMICGIIQGTDYLNIHQQKAAKANDRWFQSDPVCGNYRFCASLFDKPVVP